jgi:hypothetical protein
MVAILDVWQGHWTQFWKSTNEEVSHQRLHITICSQSSVPRTRIGRILLMARTDLKVPSIFLIFLSKENPFRSNTDTSNSRTQ